MSADAPDASRDVASGHAVTLLFAPGSNSWLEKRQSAAGTRGACGAGIMSKLLRGVAAGWGAKKLGGGCFSTILVFILLWYLLGHFQIFQ